MKAKIISTLIGDENEFSFRHRLFNVIALVGICMSFSASIINYILGLGVVTVVLTIGCGVISIVLYLFSIIGKKYELPALITVLMLSFILFPALWIINGGSYGSIPYYMIINAGIIAILLDGFKRGIVFVFFAVLAATLIAIEYQAPNFVVGYGSQLTRCLDSSFGFFVCLVSNAVFFAVFVDSYFKERQRSDQYFSKLEEQKKEIEAKNKILEKNNAELKKSKEKVEGLNKLLYEEKQKLEKLSITDVLTGTYNKMYITARLEDEIEISQENKGKLAVALIDIDNFKMINDTYGHLYGDYVLKRVGESINNNLRQNDIAGRFGGEEFLIVLPDTSLKDAYSIVERIRGKIWELKWRNNLKVTISGGVTELGSNNLTELLREVDRLLYKAKFNGKNQIEKKYV